MRKTAALVTTVIALSPMISAAEEPNTVTAPPRIEPILIDAEANFRPASDAIAELTPLESDKGQALLDPEKHVDFHIMEAAWIPQYKSHCGAASAVVTINALLPELALTQDCLFIPETSHIITQDVVYRIGFTLEELENMIETRAGLQATRFHAGEEEGHHDYESWLEALKKNNESPDTQLVLNFAGGWLYDRKNTGGHFSPVGAYNEEANQVLILEVNPSRQKYWVDAKEMWDAMNKVDRVSGLVRGWIFVEKEG